MSGHDTHRTRIIRENRDEEADLNYRQAQVRAAQEELGPHKVIPPYFPRDLMAGDPASDSGVKVAESELDAALQAKLNAAGQLLEVVLTFSADVPPGTAINIQDGTYAGAGSPATLEGDLPDFPTVGDLGVWLSPTGAEFEHDGRITVSLNGQELQKGRGAGDDEAQWVSTTQLRFSMVLHPGNEVTVRSPLVPPSPPSIPQPPP